MEKLIQVEETEVKLEFELGRKCKTTLHLKNLMQSVHVAFKVQTTNPERFAVNPPNGFLPPHGNCSFDVVFKPSNEIPHHFPRSKDIILVKTVPAVDITPDLLPERVSKEWFAEREDEVRLDAKLRVIYTGGFLLRHIVEQEDAAKLQELLETDLKNYVTEVDKETGITALHIAAANGNIDIVKLLMDAGAIEDVVSQTGQTPLLEAVCIGHYRIVAALITRNNFNNANLLLRDRHGWTALHLAASLNHVNILNLLLEREVLEYPNVKDINEGMAPLHFAAMEGHVECVKSLVEAGADMDALTFDGCTAMFKAASRGHAEVVDLLSEYGANKRIRNNAGQTPLDVALLNGHTQVVESLQYGDDLLDSARSGDLGKVISLVKNGAKLNRTDQFGWTALHCAAFKGYTDLVEKLIELGAEIDSKDMEGHTPLHCAVYSGKSEMIEVLVRHGANVEAQTLHRATASDIAKALCLPFLTRLLSR